VSIDEKEELLLDSSDSEEFSGVKRSERSQKEDDLLE
jgi:hypothetical protein